MTAHGLRAFSCEQLTGLTGLCTRYIAREKITISYQSLVVVNTYNHHHGLASARYHVVSAAKMSVLSHRPPAEPAAWDVNRSKRLAERLTAHLQQG